MAKKLLVHTILLLINYYSTLVKAENKCNLKNITVSVKEKNTELYNHTIDYGCIERAEFGDTMIKITEAYIRMQPISKLSEDSVRNMVALNTISFWGCPIEVLERKPFRNVPKLKNVQISYGKLKEIPRDVFNLIPEMELLRIHNNEIDIVEDQAFANLLSLRRIYASDNKLEYWNREWFTNTTKLEIIDFQSNQIRTIPRRAFENFKKIREIYFDFNEISRIHEGAFKGITNLNYLGLRHNRLTVINEDIFPNALKVRSFLIDANYLNFLPNEVLKKMSVKDITVDNNPWKCPCLDRIKFWLLTTNGTMRVSESCTSPKIPVCAFPKTFSYTCLEYVDSELTKKYLDTIKNIDTPKLHPACIRLD